MKTFVAIAACLLAAGPVLAQMAPPPGAIPEYLQNRNDQIGFESNRPALKAPDTDAQREARLHKAIALRAEAEKLTIADGGVMTRSHQRYIQAKANKIRSE